MNKNQISPTKCFSSKKKSTKHKIFHRSNILNFLLTFGIFVSASSFYVQAASGTWTSKTTGSTINYTTTEATTPLKDYTGKYLTVVYLENLGIKKIGQNTNAVDVAWLLSQGYRVIELDYANNAKAISPTINTDIVEINDAIFAGSFCGLTTCSQYRSYILFEGYRIARDVSYFLDDPTIYNYPTSYTYTNGDSLHMDIIYPANPSTVVPVVLSFSYSNSSGTDANRDQRLNLGNTLAGFNDSFLEGAPANGIAWAIADHPKYCDWGQGKPTGGANKAYASYETNPDAAQKVKSAIRTLRSLGTNLGLSGKIGIYGFSRGSTAGSMAVGDKTVTSFENAGLYQGTNDDVQVAALGSGVFDYTLIYDTEESDVGNLRTNCPLVWGELASNYSLWQTQGSSYLAETSSSAPVIFFYNTTDASYYQHQIAKFKAKLDSIGVTTATIVNYGTGHAVPQTSASLNSLYNFFIDYLTPPTVKSGLFNPLSLNLDKLKLTVSPNPAKNEINISYLTNTTENIQIEICNQAGKTIYNFGKQNVNIGNNKETLNLSDLKLADGIYIIKLKSGTNQATQKFVKVQ